MIDRIDFIDGVGLRGINSPSGANSPAPGEADKNILSQAHKTAPRWLRGAAAFLMIAGCLAIFVPFSPIFPDNSLDGSWMYAINVAVDKSMNFGSDVAFTFGPYASTYTRQYHPVTDMQMLWSSALLALALAIGLIMLAHDQPKLLGLLIVPFLGLNTVDQLFFSVPLVFVLTVTKVSLPATHSSRLPLTTRTRSGLALVVAALSLLPLIKGTFGVAAVVAVGVGCVAMAVRGERGHAIGGALLFLIGVSAFWVVSGQPIGQLPAFFAAQAPVIAGYSDAMSISGSVREPIIYFIACGVIGLCSYKFVRSGGFSAIVLAVGMALLLWLGFKAGFVRHDGHAIAAGGVIGLTAWMLMIGLPGARPILGLAFCLICWGIIDRHYNDLNFGTITDRVARPFVNSFNGIAARIVGSEIVRRQFDESVAAIRVQQPLPALKGTVDIYSFGQSTLLANGLDWAPRPVVQSYSAYTSDLLEKDAAYLGGSKAPDNIIFAVQPIDGRLGALEDGLSWPALLTRYAPAALIDYMAILRRRREPTTDHVLLEPPVASGAYRLGEEIALPAVSGALWAKVDVAPTFLGKILALVYKLPQLAIEFRTADGTINRFRYIAEMGKTGFVVSPLVKNARDFLALELPETAAYFADDRPQSIKISIVGGTSAQLWWSENFSLQLFKMNIPPQPEAVAALFSQSFAEETGGLAVEKLPETKDCAIDHINDHAVDKLPTAIRGVLRIEGWAAMSIEDGAAPDQTRIALTGKDGQTHALIAKITARHDIGRFFERPEMGNIGFAALADISKFDGVYTLGILVSANGETRACAKRVVLSIDASRPD